jgi:4,5-DOPA dioxygenase extradiol
MPTQPTIFFGHGSPMNALETNEFTTSWKNTVVGFAKPDAILVISAHWQTSGTFITGGEKFETIHDFGGFTQELFDMQYPATGNKKLASEIAQKLELNINNNRGLDHGVWSVLAHIYPQADVPVLQLSLDVNKTPQEHFDLGQKLAYLREKNVMILGSGNIVHNLGLIDWAGQQQNNWAGEFNQKIVSGIESRQFDIAINYNQFGDIATRSVPTNEHYLPLLYVLGASNPEDKLEIFNNKVVMGALTMTCVKFF